MSKSPENYSLEGSQAFLLNFSETFKLSSNKSQAFNISCIKLVQNLCHLRYI